MCVKAMIEIPSYLYIIGDTKVQLYILIVYVTKTN